MNKSTLQNFIHEAFELNNNSIKIIDGYKVVNFIVDDLLTSCDAPLQINEINNNTKCSKSAIPLAIQSIKEGKETILCIGNFKVNDTSKICGHVFVISDGEILQTHVPKNINPNEVTAHIEIKLVPNDVEKSINIIKQKLND